MRRVAPASGVVCGSGIFCHCSGGWIVTAREVARICDDAPASVFAAVPVSPYRAGFEDATEPGGRWWCSWTAGSPGARRYAQGWQDGKQQQVEVMQ